MLYGKVRSSPGRSSSHGITRYPLVSVKKGTTLERSYVGKIGGAPVGLYSMLPRATGDSWVPSGLTLQQPGNFTSYNTRESEYYVPEFDVILRRIISLKQSNDEEALNAYVQSRIAYASAIMEVSGAP